MNKETAGCIKEGERLDDLQRNNLFIIQNPEKFCFGMDAVLLSGFAAAHAASSCRQILDLCTGNGIIPLLLSAKTKADKITGIEIQTEIAEMAVRSVSMNSLEDKIAILNCDIKEASDHIRMASFDMVTVNPPYFKAGHGITNPEDSKTISTSFNTSRVLSVISPRLPIGVGQRKSLISIYRIHFSGVFSIFPVYYQRRFYSHFGTCPLAPFYKYHGRLG